MSAAACPRVAHGLVIGGNPQRTHRVGKDMQAIMTPDIDVAAGPLVRDAVPGAVRAHGPACDPCSSATPRPAEELVQDAFVRVLRRWSGLREPEAYLQRAVVNATRSHLRRRMVERRHVPTRRSRSASRSST